MKAALPCLGIICTLALAAPAHAQWRVPDAPESVRLSLAALVAAAWLAFAVWAVIRAQRAEAHMRVSQEWGSRLRGLVSTVPVGYLVVGQDSSATCSDTLREWLSIKQQVTHLDDLKAVGETVLQGADLAHLIADIEALSVSGSRFQRPLRLAQSQRLLIAEGRSAPAEVAGDGGVVVWFQDATESRQTVDRLERECQRLTENLDAATALLEAAPFPIWRRDNDLKLRHVNSAYVKAVEANGAAEAVVRNIELVNNALSTAPQKAAQRARDMAELQVREEDVIIGGERRTLQLFDVPLGDLGIGGFAIDVSDREKVRDALGRHLRAQTQTLDRLSAGVAIISAKRRLTFSNAAFAALFGLSPDWLAERPELSSLFDRMRAHGRLPEERDYPAWKRTRLAWLTDLIEPLEETWLLPDNAIIRTIAQPHPSGGLLLVFEDLTERLQLASSRDTLLKVHSETLDNLHEAVAVFGPDGRLELFNTRFVEMWLLNRDELGEGPHLDRLVELCGSRFSDLSGADDLRSIVRQATVGRQPESGRLLLADGQVLDHGAVPLPDGNALVTFVDVTDSTRIENALRDRNDALEAADRIKSQFVANISYELRTPLTSIIGFAEMLSEEYLGGLNDAQKEYLTNILTSSERLMLLINDILDLAVTEAGALLLDISTVELGRTLLGIVPLMEERARTKGVELSVDIDRSAGVVEADEGRLKQVVNNLVANAVQFTPAGGTVSVRAYGDAESVTIEVTDTGIGIPADEQDTVFERFMKASNAGSRTGVGLGLSLVREFVSLHSGTVSLDSKLNKGTTVSVNLPRRQDEDRAAAE